MGPWRTPALIVAVITLTGSASGASAQTPALLASPAPAAAPASSLGEIDFGGRIMSTSGDGARFQRLRDLRDGLTLDRLRYTRETADWRFDAEVDHAGYRDQRYVAGFNRYGRVKARVEWNQVPLFYGSSTRTPYRNESPAVFRLPDSTQSAVQAGTPLTLAYASEVKAFDLRSRRDVADLRIGYAVTPRLDLKVSMKSTARGGTQPWGASFGHSVPVELAAPVEHRTNDFSATAEWSNRNAMARLAYDGSWFNNAVESILFDNPLRATDQAGGTSQGRMALWPDSTAHTVSATGSIGLPGRTRALAYLSVGGWLQDAELLPFTVNSAIAPPTLPRSTARADARIVSMTYRVTSRPAPAIWLNGQFKRYDYDNRTPRFVSDRYVAYDATLATAATGGSPLFGQTRDSIDLDASYTPLRFIAFRAGYGREQVDRTFRYVEHTTEQTLRGAVDSTGLPWGSLRLQYDRSVRDGKGLEEEVLSDIGEQPSLRQFDISDRTRNRVTAIAQVVPFETVGLNASLALGRERHPGAAFGLQDNNLRSATVGVDFTPSDGLTAGASLGLEQYDTLQRSRQANTGDQFNDPTRDWSMDMAEAVRTFTANLELPRVTSRTALRFAYDDVWSKATYAYLLPTNTSLATPQPLAPVRNQVQRLTADLRQSLGRQLALGVGYTYDSYSVDDFARSPGTLNNPLLTTMVNLLYQLRDYTAHTGSVRLIYTWR